MPTVDEETLRNAVRHIARHGDTDVFPFPLEKHWFADDEDGVVTLLKEVDRDFDGFLAKYPMLAVKSLAGVGYNGFRAATQIDPLWDAYLLALVLQIAPDIERARIPTTAETIYSYRYSPDPSSTAIFAKDIGWTSYQRRALDLASSSLFILATDISDFYPRIYHHRLQNALNNATANKEAVKRIDVLLFKISGDTSYGLPIGGDAARLLAEAFLNPVDRLLRTARVSFVRFVDDYLLFADNREDAQRALVNLSDFLLRNEGLTLSRAKSRLMSAAEFRGASPLAEPAEADGEAESNKRRFLRIRWRYDPYSATADEDYEKLVDELEKFDVMELLAREFRKTRVDETLVRQIVRSLRFLSPNVKKQAVVSLIDNLTTLYPVFPTVAIALRTLLSDVDEQIKARLFDRLRQLLREGSHITMVPVNTVYAVRLLAFDPNDETDVILAQVHNSPSSNEVVKRDVIYAMARRGARYWISDLVKRHGQLTPWEHRAVIAASYGLADEGRHWRRRRTQELSDVDRAFQDWIGRKNSGRVWEIPL